MTLSGNRNDRSFPGKGNVLLPPARARSRPPPGLRIFVVGDVFQNVLHPAVQNFAQRVQGGGGDGLAVLHAVERVGVHPLFEDQVVFGDIFLKKCLIKGTITDHVSHRNQGYHTEYIDYTENIQYNGHRIQFLCPKQTLHHINFIQRRG